MKVIWKYLLRPQVDVQILQIPKDSRVLTVQFDLKENSPALWAIVDPDEERVPRTFIVKATGFSEVDETKEMYIGTYQHSIFVWHVFEILE